VTVRDERSLYVIAYDIADDARRSRLAATLEDFLPRVQESVFEGRLTETLVSRLRSRILEIVNVEEDSVRIYRLCAGCEKNMENLGGVPSQGDEGFIIV
jgi:CRISPR-associated protein Cas2